MLPKETNTPNLKEIQIDVLHDYGMCDSAFDTVYPSLERIELRALPRLIHHKKCADVLTGFNASHGTKCKVSIVGDSHQAENRKQWDS